MSTSLRGVVRAGVPANVRDRIFGDLSTRVSVTTLSGRRPLIAAGVLLLIAVAGPLFGAAGIFGSVLASIALVGGLIGFASMRAGRRVWARGDVPWAWRASAISDTRLVQAFAPNVRAAQTLATYQRLVDDLRRQRAVITGWIAGLDGDVLDDIDWAAAIKVLAAADVQVLPQPGVRDRIGALGRARVVVWGGDDSALDAGIAPLLALTELAEEISRRLAVLAFARDGAPVTGRPMGANFATNAGDVTMPPIDISALLAAAEASLQVLRVQRADLPGTDGPR